MERLFFRKEKESPFNELRMIMHYVSLLQSNRTEDALNFSDTMVHHFTSKSAYLSDLFEAVDVVVNDWKNSIPNEEERLQRVMRGVKHKIDIMKLEQGIAVNSQINKIRTRKK